MIVSKVFYLQVFKHDYYVNVALAAQQGYKELEASRGEVFLRDFHSENDFRVATNINLKTLFADPSYLDYPDRIVDALLPLLFDSVEALKEDQERLKILRQSLPEELDPEQEVEILKPKSLAEMRSDYADELRAKLMSKRRERIILTTEASPQLQFDIESLGMDSVVIEDEAVIIYPRKISDQRYVSKLVAPILEMSVERLQKILQVRIAMSF